MTSKWRRCDVITSHRRHYDVMCLLGIWPPCPPPPPQILTLAPPPPNILNPPTPMICSERNDLPAGKQILSFGGRRLMEREVTMNFRGIYSTTWKKPTNVESTLSLRTFDTSLFFNHSVWIHCHMCPPFLPVSTRAQLVKERMSSYGSKFFPLLMVTVKDAGKMKITELLPMKLYPFTLRQNVTVEKKDALT